MSTTITMPQLGETVTEGTILRWAKQVGDSIAEDEVLVEISTDKVDTEVPSPAGGKILEILVPEGDTVEVGTPLVVIGEEGEEAQEAPEPAAEEPAAEEPAEEPAAEEPAEESAAKEPAEEPKPAEEEKAAVEQSPPPSGDGKPNLMSPVVRKLVRENDLDISQITGSGQGGRITRRDVEAFMETAAAAPKEPAAEAPAAPAEPKVEEPVAATPAPPAPAPAEGVEEVELSRLRVRIGENMIRAKQTAAHVWTSVEVDYERLERVRQAHKAEFKEAEGFSLTYLPFIARATIDALKEYPAVNSSLNLEEKKAVFHKAVNLGVAIDLDREGLIVATVPNADGLRLVGLARAIRALAEKGRAGKLSLDEIAGSTFTITNPGPFGSYLSAPIINVPNTGILSTETVTKRPAVVTTPDGQDTIAIRHIGYLGLTWDHRAWDGSTAVLFLQRIKQNLETWDWEQELA